MSLTFDAGEPEAPPKPFNTMCARPGCPREADGWAGGRIRPVQRPDKFCPCCGRESLTGDTCHRCESNGHTALTMEVEA